MRTECDKGLIKCIPQPETDKEEVLRFFALAAPGEKITFQTFTDAKVSLSGNFDPLAKVFHGAPTDLFDRLRELNKQGAGVYWMVNRGDLKGRRKINVLEVRHAFVDLDKAPLAPVEKAAEPPSLIVESSPLKYHAYWLWVQCPLDCFTPMQLALAKKFGGDEKVTDLPRVLRVPGFLHQKNEPFRSKIRSAKT